MAPAAISIVLAIAITWDVTVSVYLWITPVGVLPKEDIVREALLNSMKWIAVILCATLLYSCKADTKKNTTGKQEQKLALVSFKNENVDFGIAKEGKQVRIVYKFINHGPVPMIIYDIKPGCGCTSAAWPKTPIKPNQEDSISVIFDTRARTGMQNKYVVLFYNAKDKAKVLTFNGLVNK